MRIYNTMTRKKEEFRPITEGTAKIYACGPTVYNYIHIGNARPLCVFDVLRRYLEYRGLKVDFIQNFTDIDDKIIKKANDEGVDYREIGKKYIEEYKIDAKGLNIREATFSPKATESISDMLDIIKKLMDKGFAYRTKEGDIYFRAGHFKGYGKLSHQPLEDLEAGARISVGEAKEDPMDFALWKAAKPGEPYWQSVWGKGRPGWHIECSAMASKYLGKTIDIHCGGQDLIFPHHENEIAQSECCNGVPFANYWMHNGHINVENKKMSKSLNNFFTVRELAGQYGYEPIRFLMLSAHYRNPINYSREVIEQCIASLERLYTCRNNLKFIFEKSDAEESVLEMKLRGKLLSYKFKFIEALEDDLNTADALSVLFDLVREINANIGMKAEVSKATVGFAADLLDELADILGLLYNKEESSLNDEIEALIEKRQEARKNKDWATADKIRDELKRKNVVLEDTPQGIKWSFVNERLKV
mgnify:FL=1